MGLTLGCFYGIIYPNEMEFDMNIKELCEVAQVDYNSNHPSYSLNKIRQIYLLKEIGKRDYEIVRKLTKQEQITGKKLTQCKQLLENTICVQLSLSENNTIRADMKGYLELFNIVNNKYRYFAYENMTEQKYKILEGFVDPKCENNTLCNYVDDVNPILYRLVKEVFKKLSGEMLIYVKEHLMFAKKYIIPNESGASTIEYLRTVEADNDQVEEYMRLFRYYADEMGAHNIDNLNNRTKYKIKAKVCHDLGITYAYTEYELILNRDGLSTIVEKRPELKELKDSLNKNIIHKLNMSQQGHLKDYSIEDKEHCSDFLIKVM